MRCKHPNARLVELRNPSGPHGYFRARCDDCDLTVMGIPYPIVSRHPCRRVSRPPKWCERLIAAAQEREHG